MRRTVRGVALCLVMAAGTLALDAATLAGVTLPDTAQVGGTTLVLNGLGIRSKYMVKVYVAGLYLQQKSTDANGILKSETPKQIVLKFLHSASKEQMTDAFKDGFGDNAAGANATIKGEIDRLVAGLDSVNVGDQMEFTFDPGRGTTLSINGKNQVTIVDAAFAPVLLSVWLGAKPPNADLKKGMLGQ
jgi:hypothetical protein